MKANSLLLILFALFFASCNQFDVLRKINTQSICEYLQVKTVEISMEETNENRTYETNFKLSINNSPLFLYENPKTELIVSKATYLFFQELKKQNIESINNIKVKINGLKQRANYEDEISFNYNQLEKVDTAIKTIDLFLTELKTNPSQTIDLLDENELINTIHPDSLINQLVSEFNLAKQGSEKEMLGFGISHDKLAVVFSVKDNSDNENFFNFVFNTNRPTKIIGLSNITHRF